MPDGPDESPTPLDSEYWAHYQRRRPKELVSSHLIKYPYSFYALAKDLNDKKLKKRLLNKLYHLSAVT